MFAMIMTILCSTMLSVFMRMSEGKADGKMTILSANYLTCILLAAGFSGVSDLFPTVVNGFPITLILGIITGVFYMLALVCQSRQSAGAHRCGSVLLRSLSFLVSVDWRSAGCVFHHFDL